MKYLEHTIFFYQQQAIVNPCLDHLKPLLEPQLIVYNIDKDLN